MAKSTTPKSIVQVEVNEVVSGRAYTTDNLPNLDNATPSFLIDEIKRLRDAQKVLKQTEGFYQQALFARHTPPIIPSSYADLNGTEIKGDKETATLTHVVQTRFDTQTFKKAQPALYEQYTNTIEFVQLKFAKGD